MKNRVISLLMASLLLVLSVIVAPFYKAEAATVVNTPFVAVFSNFDSSQWEKAIGRTVRCSTVFGSLHR